MYNIGLVSLGCAKNQTDAEIMLGILANGSIQKRKMSIAYCDRLLGRTIQQ